MWLDLIRYYLALLVLAAMPVGLLFWLLIHPFAEALRPLGLFRVYLVIAIPISLLFVTIIWFRHALLAVDFGTSYLLMALSLVPFTLAIPLYLQHGQYLTPTIRIGIPELRGAQDGVLLTQGIYGRMRHPRYVQTVLWLLGFALFTNYLALYVLFLLTLPVIHLIVLLEEKELRQRFGPAYEAYARRVPRYIPKR